MIFVDGQSTDQTRERILEQIARHAGRRDIKLLDQVTDPHHPSPPAIAPFAATTGWLAEADCLRIIHALAGSGLPIHSPLLTRRLCLDALAEAQRHRRHLVLPKRIGQAAFVEDAESCSTAMLDSALDWLESLGSDLSAGEAGQEVGAHA